MRPVHGSAPVAGPRNAIVGPILAAAPAAPLSLAEQPSTPPQVSYQSGMLTIVAQNSSLGDILREVHKSTGAAIDVPANATERVVARIGPGPARDVLASLLNGSTFDYVMLGSVTDPTSLASVMLTMKTGVGAHSSETAANVYQPPPQQMSQQAPMVIGNGPGGSVVQPAQPNDEEADAADEKDEEDPAEEDQTQDAQNGAATAPDPSQPNGGPKTPEQILEMLRQHPPGQVVPGQQVIQPPNQQPPNDDN